ncbi:MAG: cation diffusion facilitator family transporter [Bowdeniella nasicola]|nr:cation diffusion facilitator family transporter [Bowdeniella nasicola]
MMHQHGHGHGHGVGAQRGRLAVALGLTFTVLIAEVIGAWWTGSLALLMDAAHMFTDVLGLTMALGAAHLASRPPTKRYSWGLRRVEVLSAGGQAALLLVVGLFTVLEAIRRFSAPPEIPSLGLLIFGIIGLAANLGAMAALMGGRDASLNVRAAFLEVVNDALGSLAVIISALFIAAFGWMQADSVAALIIATLIIPRTLILLRESFGVLLEATPRELDVDEMRDHMMSLEHVLDVHDLHVSYISTDLPVLTAHVVVEERCFTTRHAAEILSDLQHCVAEHFPIRIEHTTFQIEPPEPCPIEELHHH